MVVVMMMLELCVQWLWPLPSRSAVRIAATPWTRPASGAHAIHMAHATAGTQLALIHAPTHRHLR